MTQRVSKLDAARLLEVSPTTIDRRIQRGELQVEMEPRGTRFRTWVILETRTETPYWEEGFGQ